MKEKATPQSEAYLSFVIFPEDGVWVAHGLQHNIVTHGESLQEIRANIDVIMEAYRRIDAIDQIERADGVYWEKYHDAVKSGRSLDDFLNAPCDDEIYTLELQTA